MARAHTIWIVLDADPRTWPVVRAFTVKHELVSWIGGLEDHGEGYDLHVLRCKDGEFGDVVSGAPDHEGIPTIHEFWKDNQ